MGSALFRPLRLLSFGFLGAVAISLLAGGLLAWRSSRRLEAVHERVQRLVELQDIELRIEQVAREGPAHSEQRREALRTELEHMRGLGDLLAAGTEERLARVEGHLAQEPFTAVALVDALQDLGTAAEREVRAQQQLLEAARAANRSERRLVLFVPLVLFALAVSVALVARRRIVAPLRDLETVVQRLALGDFVPVATTHVDPLLGPLFNNYNHLVRRLDELEQRHRDRARTLEAEVRDATHALLEQHRDLARAERLAATGMLAASLAHELRNPLAGVALALRNLRGEIEDPEATARLELVAQEVRRVQGLLNGLLDGARVIPEPPRPQDLAASMRSLLALVRYQIPDHIELVHDVPENLQCELPASRLHQAVLNLVLNSAQALDGQPGRITVTARQDGATVSLRVCDDGPGFPPDVLQRGARPFASTRKGGTGLGLPMVKRFVEDLDGTLELTNAAGGGASVTMVLPCRAAHA